jgi:hypothetical protein
MKKALLLILALTLVVSVVFAEFMNPGPQMKAAEIRETLRLTQPSRPDTAIINFSIVPIICCCLIMII